MGTSTSARRAAGTTVLAAAAALTLAACSGDDGDASDGPATETVTVTETPSDPPSETASPSDSGTAAPADPGTPAEGEIPTDPQTYAQALVDAWLDGDRATAESLVADPDDADELFDDDDIVGVPEFSRCEGAAGSTYCTWIGQGYEIVIQVANEAASLGELGAVLDVEVED